MSKFRSFWMGMLFAAVSAGLSAQEPQGHQFSYQGRLLDNGTPANGEFDLRFSLHSDPDHTAPSPPTVDLPAWPVVDGLVVVELNFPHAFEGRQRWLQMEVNGEMILPRQPVLTTPVAQFALETELHGEVTGQGSSNQVSGARIAADPGTLVRRDLSGAIEASVVRGDLQGNADSASLAAQAVSADTAGAFTGLLAGDVTGLQGATSISPGAVTATKIADNQVVKSVNGLRDQVTLAGAGTVSVNSSGSTLTIQGGGISGVTAGSGLTGGGSSGVVPLAINYGGNGSASTASRSDHTHYGQTWSGSGNGLRVVPTTENARAIEGGSGTLTAYEASGVTGIIFNTTARSVGIYGATLSNDPDSAGVFGQATTAGGAKGVWGWASGADTVAVQATGSNGGLAGRFQGNVQITGTLSKGGGSFKIDHPLDPENKYLYHSFVESPDMKNIYDGVVTLDARGMAVVEMATWFSALNRDFRYQLTAVGAAMPGLHIAETLHDGRFVIAGGVDGGRVSWQVTGIRQDAWAEANRIPIEQDKPGNERGRYLHPEARGLPNSRAVHPPTGQRAH